MAEIIVTRTSGKKVTLRLWRVDRQRRRVGIDIPDPYYNARLIFTDVAGKVKIVSDSDRIKIDSTQEAVLHVSGTVYSGMVRWAASILNAPR